MLDEAALDLNHVRVFAVVAERGTLTAAAAALAVPTSTVSRALTALEGALGTRLLHRTPRDTQLTAAGTAYYAQVRGALAELERARRRLADEQVELAGPIRITASPVVAAGLLAPLIARFRAAHPGVWFELIATTATVDLVRERVDLALRARRVAGGDVVARKVCTTLPRLYAAASYAERRGIPTAPAELVRHDAVSYRAHVVGGRWRLYSERGATRDAEVRAAVVCDDFGVVRQAVLEGQGIGVVPPFFARADLAARALVPVLPRYSLEPVPMWLVSPRPVEEPARITAFKRALVERMLTFVTQRA